MVKHPKTGRVIVIARRVGSNSYSYLICFTSHCNGSSFWKVSILWDRDV